MNGWLIAALILMSLLVAYTRPAIAQTPAQRDLIEDICNAYLATGDGDLQPRVDPFSAEGTRRQERLATLVNRWKREYSDDTLWRTTTGGYGFSLCPAILNQGIWPPLAPGDACKATLPTDSPCAELQKGTCAADAEEAACWQAKNVVDHARCTPLVKAIITDQCRASAQAAKVRCEAYPEACARAKAAQATDSAAR